MKFTQLNTKWSKCLYLVRNILQAHRSPIQLRFDEQHQACLTQNQRKDSASSEVAALLSISGRTSRISSVGSQGSAVSAISRSPSPSNRINQNIPIDVLDQAIWARKQELQHDFRADLARNGRKDGRNVTNGSDASGKRMIGVVNAAKKAPTLKNTAKPIVGVTPEGTQYIRIKLKPDHLYNDNGLGANERMVDDPNEALKRPPASLSLGQETPKKAAPHFTQLVQADENRLTPNLSPKTTRQGLRSSGSRSPSPCTVAVSRKSSFCSLFKSKETILSPESPTAAGQRKKSAISVLLDSPRDRSRSKSRDSDRSAPSQNGTPSKQKSILAIFKPKRSGSKSKSASPIDQEIMAAMETQNPVDIRFLQELNPAGGDSRPKSAQRLRYYDDGVNIHIPLHTPPDEKENAFFATETAKQSAPGQCKSQPKPAQQHAMATLVATACKENPSFHPKNIKPMMTNTTTTTTTTQPTSRSQTPKIYRIENPDGSIRIPLRSPSEENVDADAEVDADADVDNSNWSTAVQRNSSQESQETVVSSQAPSLNSTDNSGVANKNNHEKLRSIGSVADVATTVTESNVTPVASYEAKTSVEVPIPINPLPLTASPLTKEKKRILFSTRIGSGSEEQIFATQLSLSKTESLSSQLSEQAALDSPPLDTIAANKDESGPSEKSDVSSEPIIVKMRHKEECVAKRQDSSSQSVSKEELINSNRHSMYIENIDEILLREKQIDIERKERQKELVKRVDKVSSHDRELSQSSSVEQTSNQLRSVLSAEDRAFSSESERDSEADPSTSKLHMPRGVGAVEEESAGLVGQDSYDDELPYVPTTLPEERSIAIPIVPIKERALMDVRTFPVDRPRSTTPLNPSFLEDYCGSQPDESEFLSARGEKLRISLPRKESRDRGQKLKSPRRVSNASGKSWFEFAEQGIGGTGVGSPSSSGSMVIGRRSSNQDDEPPPVPPRRTQNATEWINFENIPEKRKAPKRITTLPQKDSQEICGAQSVQYNYVNPEECQCECHEIEREGSGGPAGVKTEKQDASAEDHTPDDTVPLLESDPDEYPHRTE